MIPKRVYKSLETESKDNEMKKLPDKEFFKKGGF